MPDIWAVELEQEVEDWYLALPDRDRGRVDRRVDRLALMGNQLRMPLSRSLGEGLFELRFHLRDEARRIPYWFASDRRIILLTTFHKQRDNEAGEVARAREAKRRCEAEKHTAE